MIADMIDSRNGIDNKINSLKGSNERRGTSMGLQVSTDITLAQANRKTP